MLAPTLMFLNNIIKKITTERTWKGNGYKNKETSKQTDMHKEGKREKKKKEKSEWERERKEYTDGINRRREIEMVRVTDP